MHPEGEDPAARLDRIERAPLADRPALYLALHAELLTALEAPARA